MIFDGYFLNLIGGLTDVITMNPYYISVVCVIPKGTVYITNDSREIVSRKVVIKGVLCTTGHDDEN